MTPTADTPLDDLPTTNNGAFLSAGLQALGFSEAEANERVRAIEAEAVDAALRAARLDVDRLARAMRTIGAPPVHMSMWLEEAERVAAEYDLLASLDAAEGDR